jgi:hypothetical protein
MGEENAWKIEKTNYSWVKVAPNPLWPRQFLCLGAQGRSFLLFLYKEDTYNVAQQYRRTVDPNKTDEYVIFTHENQIPLDPLSTQKNRGSAESDMLSDNILQILYSKSI